MPCNAPYSSYYENHSYERDEEGRAPTYTHLTCGKPAGLEPVCQSCGKSLRREDLIAEQVAKYRRERDARWQAFKAGRWTRDCSGIGGLIALPRDEHADH